MSVTEPIAVLTALDWEERAVVTALGGRDALCDGTPAVARRCGIGLRSALETARDLPPVRCIVVVGCAGALQPALRTGDLVVASAVGLVDPAGQVQSHWPSADAGVAAAAKRAGLSVHVGPIVSSPMALLGAPAKAGVATSGALTVDMETAAIMGVALQRRVPLVAIRVVIDECADEWPTGLDMIDERGDVRVGPAVRAVLRHPRTMLSLLRQRTVCERTLRAALPALLRADALGFARAEQPAASA